MIEVKAPSKPDGASQPFDIYDDPFEWFGTWFKQAAQNNIKDYNAFALGTVSEDGYPSIRIVYLKQWDERGFVFYTNFKSRKGCHLLKNPKSAMTCYLKETQRQIRIEGEVERISDSQADAYFASRPRGSKLGAWASKQSQHLEDKKILMDSAEAFKIKYEDQSDVPRPAHWSGFRLKPLRIEFWQAGKYRLHDRVEFLRQGFEQSWEHKRLYP